MNLNLNLYCFYLKVPTWTRYDLLVLFPFGTSVGKSEILIGNLSNNNWKGTWFPWFCQQHDFKSFDIWSKKPSISITFFSEFFLIFLLPFFCNSAIDIFSLSLFSDISSTMISSNLLPSNRTLDLGCKTFHPRTFKPQVLIQDFSTMNFSTMNFSTTNFSTMNFSTMNFSTMNFSNI